MYHEFKGECVECDSGVVGIGMLPFGGEYGIECASCEGTGEVEYGSFEAFYLDQNDIVLDYEDTHGISEGWYWWPCFPGCLPDGDPIGPFVSEERAIEDAQNW